MPPKYMTVQSRTGPQRFSTSTAPIRRSLKPPSPPKSKHHIRRYMKHVSYVYGQPLSFFEEAPVSPIGKIHSRTKTVIPPPAKRYQPGGPGPSGLQTHEPVHTRPLTHQPQPRKAYAIPHHVNETEVYEEDNQFEPSDGDPFVGEYDMEEPVHHVVIHEDSPHSTTEAYEDPYYETEKEDNQMGAETASSMMSRMAVVDSTLDLYAASAILERKKNAVKEIEAAVNSLQNIERVDGTAIMDALKVSVPQDMNQNLANFVAASTFTWNIILNKIKVLEGAVEKLSQNIEGSRPDSIVQDVAPGNLLQLHILPKTNPTFKSNLCLNDVIRNWKTPAGSIPTAVRDAAKHVFKQICVKEEDICKYTIRLKDRGGKNDNLIDMPQPLVSALTAFMMDLCGLGMPELDIKDWPQRRLQEESMFFRELGKTDEERHWHLLKLRGDAANFEVQTVIPELKLALRDIRRMKPEESYSRDGERHMIWRSDRNRKRDRLGQMINDKEELIEDQPLEPIEEVVIPEQPDSLEP